MVATNVKSEDEDRHGRLDPAKKSNHNPERLHNALTAIVYWIENVRDS